MYDSLDRLISFPKTAPILLQGLGASVRLLVSSPDTAGAWCLIDYQAPAGFSGPHFHYHAKTTEVFYVISKANLTFRSANWNARWNPGNWFGLRRESSFGLEIRIQSQSISGFCSRPQVEWKITSANYRKSSAVP